MIPSKEKLQEKRTPEELDKFVKKTFDSIASDEIIKKQARMLLIRCLWIKSI
jgi:hypothetical protein